MDMTAEGDNVIEGRNRQFLYQFEVLAEDVSPRLGHTTDCPRI
jgi:hypothetical protein